MMLLRSLLEHGKIETTLVKAKTIQPMMDRLITKAKRATNADKIEIRKKLADEKYIAILMDYAKSRFGKRTSGYTRVIRLGIRVGDAGDKVLLEFVDAAAEPVKKEVGTKENATEAKEAKKPAAKTEEKKPKTGKSTK